MGTNLDRHCTGRKTEGRLLATASSCKYDTNCDGELGGNRLKDPDLVDHGIIPAHSGSEIYSSPSTLSAGRIPQVHVNH